MATFVLVPGAWLGRWAWADVADRLRSDGHDVHPITLPGLAERAAEATPAIDLDAHVADLVRTIEERDMRDMSLVGHSYAGFVITGVADRVADRLAQLVYVDSGPIPDGMSMLDFFGPEIASSLRERVAEDGDGWRLPFPPLDELGPPAAIGDIDDGTYERMRRLASPQPFATYEQPLRRVAGYEGGYERIAIVAGGTGMTVDQLKEVARSGEGPFSEMAAPDWRFVDLPTGHWPMLTAPDRLASTLVDIAAPIASR